MKRWMFALGLLALAAQAGDMGTLRYPGELKQKPFLDAAKVSDLAANASVEVVARQGGWMQVKTKDGQLGWVKMLSVRLGSGDSGSGGFGAGLLALGSSLKTGSSGTTSTTGVKGLGELTAGSLENAQPAPAEMAKLDGVASNPDAAAKFAKSAKLVAQKDLPYLPKPSDKH